MFLRNISSKIISSTIPTFRINSIAFLSRGYSTKKYTKEHEWIEIKDDEGSVGIIGITDYAQNSLGDVVYVALPEIGLEVKKSDVLGSVESVKAASDIYAPISGKVVESNEKLLTEPVLINNSWLCKIKLSDSSELKELLDEVIRLTKKQFLMPGFVDTHTHAPQYPNAGTGMDLPLLEWLKKYTFPLEKSYSSMDFTKKIYPIVVSHLLRNGTTTAVYYATIHLEASKYLVDVINQKGQRAFVGKINMDRNSPIDYIEENVESSIKDTEHFVEYVLNSIGTLAKKYDIPIQSHLSENTAELEFVKKLFPHIKNYTAVYDHYGLLNHQAIMAHGIHLSSEERKLLRQRKVGISHCPNSNFALRSGVCNVRQLLNDGIKVGLGTDISGGHAKSMLDAIRSASTASRVIHMASSEKEDEEYDDNDNSISAYSSLTLSELTYLATMGGAELVNLQNVIGNFIIGKEFDALWVDPEAKNSPLDIFDNIDDALERIFEKFIFLGDERNLKAVFVKGRRVSGTDI
ncbi:16810_t:CDS:2 [Entrophospora sp. SA101]|nr:16810_t:CDS:2 [Entrophospora sp. SA101]